MYKDKDPRFTGPPRRAALKPKTRKHATPPDTFASAVARRTGLKQVRFAVPARDYPPVARAKRRFGTVAVARLLGLLCRQVLTLCRTAARK